MFKKLFFIFALLIFHFSLFAQQASPSYIDVIKTFCKNYKPTDDNDDYTAFAKKKNGWYIIQVNRLQSDRLLNERLFFSFAENKYLDLESYYDKAGEIDMDKLLKRYLSPDGGIYDWYRFEHVAYYGYNGWCNEMIDDFSKRQNMPDTSDSSEGRPE